MPPLVFAPGTMCDQRVWEPVWAALGGDVGISYLAVEAQHTREGMRGLFEAASNTSGPLHLVAFSMSGYLALEFTITRPNRVASLVLVSSSAFGLTQEESAERVRALRWLETHAYRGAPASRLGQFIHPSRQADPAVMGVMQAMDRDLGQEVLVAQLRETSDRVSLKSRLPDLARPVLIIGADTDPFVPVASLDAMAALMRGARRIIATDTGHMIPLERPEWLAAQIRAFHQSLTAAF